MIHPISSFNYYNGFIISVFIPLADNFPIYFSTSNVTTTGTHVRMNSLLCLAIHSCMQLLTTVYLLMHTKGIQYKGIHSYMTQLTPLYSHSLIYLVID